MRIKVKREIVAAALSLLATVTALAQAPSLSLQVGTGRISGRVIAADGSGPLSRADVRLSGPAPGSMVRAVLTDAQGRYEFTELPAGSYTLSAERRGYLSLQYGQRRTESAIHPVEIASGQVRDDVDFALPKGGVIAVRVTDELGNPRAGVSVRTLRYRGTGDHRKLVSATPDDSLTNMLSQRAPETNDRGEIRLFNLPSGDYWLLAALPEFRSYLMDLPTENIDRQLFYPPTYYPGTASARDAQPLSLDAGEELSVGITLVPTRTAHVSGRVVSSEGTPVPGYVVLKEVHDNVSSEARFRQELSDGRFTFWDIRPGEYVIEKPIDETQFPQDEYGALSVTVSGDNLSDLTITTAKAGTLRGHVVFDTGSPPPDMKIEDLAISALALENGLFVNGRFKDDWSFAIEGITSPANVEPSGDWGPWLLKALVLNGVDVTGTRLVSADDLQVVLTQTFTTVSGTVTDDQGVVVLNCSVLFFPEDRARLDDQYIAMPRGDQQGRFRITRLPPGRYLAVAIEGMGFRVADDPDLLSRLKKQATSLTLGEGESKTLTLKLTTF